MLRRSPAEIASPPPSPRRRDAGTHPLLRRLAGSRRRGRHQAERVLNAEVPYVLYSIGWIAKKFDYINRVNKRFRLRSTRVRRHTLPSRCYASPWIDLACAWIFFCFPCNVRQQFLPSLCLESTITCRHKSIIHYKRQHLIPVLPMGSILLLRKDYN